jgi:hypothetical protein
MALTAKGFTSVLAQRREPPDALDYFPTPPWATRALFRHVLPALGIDAIRSVWEPACGEGHMAAVIAEFTSAVIASDIFDHGYGNASHDFLYDADPDRYESLLNLSPYSLQSRDVGHREPPSIAIALELVGITISTDAGKVCNGLHCLPSFLPEGHGGNSH